MSLGNIKKNTLPDSQPQQEIKRNHDYMHIKRIKCSIANRISNIKVSRWIRFSVVSIIFFLWVIWMCNPWLGLFWFLLIDIYITNYIPWEWWKKLKPGILRTTMSWVDAIVYGLILAYFIFSFIGQNYMIPSSSLEKSLLVGDYIMVNKVLYGPRVPQTLLHFPLAQHTIPFINTKSYIDKPQLKYHRLKGIRAVERGDIVVFNFPQGDTVPSKISNPDYYQICYELRKKGIDNPKKYIDDNPNIFGNLLVRPVDRRENYVKRAIGLPGERIKIVLDTIYINGKPLDNPTNIQFNYIVQVKSTIPYAKWESIGMRREDIEGMPFDALGCRIYDVPLTEETKMEVEKWSEVNGSLIRESESGICDLSGVFPLGNEYGWTRSNMGELWIPQKDKKLHLTNQNLPIYRRAIEVYEGNKVEICNGEIFINGKQSDCYRFKMDYYWMMGDNRDRSLDSRYWGFVPEDHIVGTPMFIIISLDEDKSLFDGKIRFNRILKNANPNNNTVFAEE